MKKSKYQQYFQCFIVFILGPYEFWFSFLSNIITIIISAGEVRHLLEGDA